MGMPAAAGGPAPKTPEGLLALRCVGGAAVRPRVRRRVRTRAREAGNGAAATARRGVRALRTPTPWAETLAGIPPRGGTSALLNTTKDSARVELKDDQILTL